MEVDAEDVPKVLRATGGCCIAPPPRVHRASPEAVACRRDAVLGVVHRGVNEVRVIVDGGIEQNGSGVDVLRSRRVVRISEKEGGKIQGLFLSIPDQTLQPSDKPLVMFKEAPAGATVVGVPGRLVEKSVADKEKAHFAAYGVAPNQEDPYLKTLQSLVDHAQELEQTVSGLTEKIRRLEQAAERSKTDPLRAIK